MNLFLKLLTGVNKYTVNTYDPSCTAGMLMSEFDRNVFDVAVKGNDSFEFYCLSVAKKRINNYLDGRKLEYSIKSIGGIPFVVRKMRFRPGLVIGILLAVLTVFYHKERVWDIIISGNDTLEERKIRAVLSEAGFEYGKRYTPDELDVICNRVIVLDDRLTRMSINLSGNAAFVEVGERRKKEDNTQHPSLNGIVAKCDCIIVRPEVFDGTALVKCGDTVRKGDILISPVSVGKDGREYFGGARGSVYAVTTEDIYVYVPYKTAVKKYTGKVLSENRYCFNGMGILLKNPFGKITDSYSVSFGEERISIAEEISLPVLKNKSDKKEYSVQMLTLSEAEAEKYAYGIMYGRLASELYDCEILALTYDTEKYNDGVVLHCRAECIRDVAEIKE